MLHHIRKVIKHVPRGSDPLKQIFKRVRPLMQHKLVLPLLSCSLLLLTTLYLILYLVSLPPRLTTAPKDSLFLYTATNSTYAAFIGAKNTKTPYVRFQHKGATIDLSFVYPINALKHETVNSKQGNEFIAKETLQNVDIKYEPLTNGLKETIVVKEKGAVPERGFFFNLKTENAEPKQTLLNGFYEPVFYDKKTGAYAFHFEPAYAVDAKNVRTDNVITQVRKNEDGKFTVSVAVSPAWINDPKRAYPIIIDPTVVHDTSAEFAGGYDNRIKDTGSGSSPVLESFYKELSTDINTVGLWHMNENAVNTCTGGSNDVCDKSGNNNDGAFNGNAAFTTSSRLGVSAITLDGTGDYISATSYFGDNNFKNTTFSIEMWINGTSFTDTKSLIYLGNTTGSNYTFEILASSTNIQAIWHRSDGGTTGRVDIVASTTLSTNQWYHIAITHTSGEPSVSNTFVYLNGVSLPLTIDGATWSPFIQSNTIYIGGRTSGVNYFPGSIDEVRISNIARTPEEIRLDAQRRPYAVQTSQVLDLTAANSWNSFTWTEAGVATGDGETPYSSTNLVAQWSLNETSGTTAATTGSCGSTCNGTLTGFDSTASQDADADSGWTANNRRWGVGALMFKGSSNYIYCTDANCGTTSKLEPTTLTVAAWFRVSTLGTYQTIVSKGDFGTGNSRSYLLRVSNANKPEFLSYYTPGGGANICTTTGVSTIVPGQWYYIIGTHNGTVDTLYLNGILETTTSCAQTIHDSTGRFGIGGIQDTTDPNQVLNGVIDSVSVYSRILPASEILSNYQAGNIEFQTRTSADNVTWEAWKPTTSEVALDAVDSLSPIEKISQTSLVGYWKLDETSGSRADSAGSNTLADNNTVTYGPGRLVNAADFESSNSEYLSIADNAALSIGSGVNLTISCWIRLESKPGSAATCVGKRTGAGAAEYDLAYVGATDRFRFRVLNSGGTDTTVNANTLGSPATNTWYHLLAWYDSSAATVNIQVNNGAIDSTGSAVTPFDGTGDFNIGRTADNSNYMDGMLDEVAVWKRVLTTAERAQVFSEGLDLFGAESGSIYRTRDTGIKQEGTAAEKLAIGAPQVDSSTVALWHLDETSGTNAYLRSYPDTEVNLLVHANGSSGSQTFTDSSTYNHSITAVGNAQNSTAQSKFGGASLYLDGTGDYLSVADNASWDLGTQNFTIDLWFRPDTGGLVADEYLVGRGSTSGGYDQYTLMLNVANPTTAHFQFIANNGAVNFYASSLTWAVQWYHLAIVRSGDTWTLYRDGTNVASTTVSTTIPDTSDPLYIGARNGGTLTASKQGYIDEVRLVKGTAVYSGNFTPFSAEHSVRFSPNDGVPTGTTVVEGFYGKGRSFNGTNETITVPYSSTMNYGTTNRITVETWMKTTQTTGTYIVVQHNDGSGGNGSSFDLQTSGSGGTISFYISNGTSWCANSATSTSSVVDGKWHHVAGVSDGSNVKMYVDGALQTTAGACTIGNSTLPITIASDYNNDTSAKYAGSLDEIKISNVARTADEIAETYRAGRDHRVTRGFTSADLSGKSRLPFYIASDRPGTFMEATVGESAFANYEPDGNTVGLWHLEEQTGSGAYIKDSSGYGNNGTPTGTTFVQGKIGKGRYFNNSGDKITYPTSSTFSFGTSDFYIDAWFYPLSGDSGYSFIVRNGVSGSGAYYLDAKDPGTSKIRFYAYNIPVDIVGIAPTLSQWNHVAITRNGSTWSLYQNGQLVNTATSAGDVGTASNSFYSGDAGTDSFYGNIDEIRVLKGVGKTADEVRQAYEIGKRTHPITIDFVTNPQATYSTGTSVTINNPSGTTALTDTLNVGDVIIFKENVGGVETVSQTTVVTVTNTSTVYGTVTVSSAPTFPSGGYSTNAKVFKWQREYWDLSNLSNLGHLNAATRLTLRVTDGSQGANVWLDDFRGGGAYLTTPGGSTITSTAQRYFQYRTIIGSADPTVSPNLSMVTLDYLSNGPPSAPTVNNSYVHDKIKTAATTPSFRFVSTDGDGDSIIYEVQVSTDSTFATATTRVSDTHAGFSNITTPTDTSPFNQNETIQFTVQAGDALTNGNTYFYRIRGKDPAGTNTWGSYSAVRSLTIDTSAINNSWFETKTGQFDVDIQNGNLSTASDKVVVTSTVNTIENADTASLWVSGNNSRVTVTQDTGDKQEGTGSTVLTTSGYQTGTQLDGACTVSSGTVDINSASCAGRGTADAVNFSVTANTSSGQNQVTVSTTPTGLAIGDEILIINLMGTAGDNANVGQYETKYITNISTNTLTLSANLTNSYNGTTQKIMVQRVPQYSNVTVSGGAVLTASAFNGTKNGVLYFKAGGTVTVTGSINMLGKGYPGGPTAQWGIPAYTYQGDSYLGVGALTTAANGGGGGGGYDSNPNNNHANGSGGGGYGTAGGAGADVGAGCISGGGGGGAAGGTYGVANLSKLYFGSGGGAGWFRAGGAGGGIIGILAKTLTVTGNVTATGGDGLSLDSCNAAGAGGAGGSVLINADSATIGSSLVVASYGSRGYQQNNSSGNGGVGRNAINYATALSGTTNPAADVSNTLQIPYDNIAVTRTLGSPLNLGSSSSVSFWVKSSRTGTYMRFEMGEAASTEQTYNFTINTANTWEQKTWDVSSIASTSKDGINYLAFRTLDSGPTYALKFDKIEANAQQNNIRTPPIYSSVLYSAAQKWKTAIFSGNDNSGTIRYRVYYDVSGTPTIVPDSALPGNAAGFAPSTQNLLLSTSTYPILYFLGTFNYTSGTSPELLDWSLNLNQIPGTPTLNSPGNGAIGQQLTNIALRTTTTDNDADYLRYKIDFCTNAGMTQNCQVFDQTVSQTGWSGQNTQGNTAYTSGTQATYTTQTALTAGTTYYWRTYAKDPAGTDTWSSTQGTPYSFTTSSRPNRVTQSTPTNNTTGLALSPSFTITSTDSDGDYLRYKIVLCKDATMTLAAGCQVIDQTSSQTGWSGQNTQSNTAYTSGTTATYTVQTPLTAGTSYWWYSYAIDPAGSNAWSDMLLLPNKFTTTGPPTTPTLDLPANGATSVALLPIMKTTSTDGDSDYIRYKLILCTNDLMTIGCQTFDQTLSQTGWSGQNTQGGTAYTTGTQATYTVQTALEFDLDYYWQTYAIDPGGSNQWSATQSAPRTFHTIVQVLRPTSCTIQEALNDSYLNINWTNTPPDETGYEIEKNTDSAGWVALITKAANSVTHQDTSVALTHTYQYRVRAYKSGTPTEYSKWCTTSMVTLQQGAFRFNNLKLNGLLLN